MLHCFQMAQQCFLDCAEALVQDNLRAVPCLVIAFGAFFTNNSKQSEVRADESFALHAAGAGSERDARKALEAASQERSGGRSRRGRGGEHGRSWGRGC